MWVELAISCAGFYVGGVSDQVGGVLTWPELFIR